MATMFNEEAQQFAVVDASDGGSAGAGIFLCNTTFQSRHLIRLEILTGLLSKARLVRCEYKLSLYLLYVERITFTSIMSASCSRDVILLGL